MSRELCDVRIRWDMSKVDFNKLCELERLMRELGVSFDTGAGCGWRDWEWDWSLKGPVKVEFCCLKKDRKKTFTELYDTKVVHMCNFVGKSGETLNIELVHSISKEDGSLGTCFVREWFDNFLVGYGEFQSDEINEAENLFFERKHNIEERFKEVKKRVDEMEVCEVEDCYEFTE